MVGKEKYNLLLKYCIQYNIDVKDIINDTTEYHKYYSNHAQSLAYLVGDLVKLPTCTERFYGMDTSVNDELGVEILLSLWRLGVETDAENYYGNNVFEELQIDHRLTRKNNLNFIKMINKIKNCETPSSPYE